MMKNILRLIVATSMFFALSSTVFAAECVWVSGGASASWNSAANWDCDFGGAGDSRVPGAGDDVTFDPGLGAPASDADVDIDIAASVDRVNITANYTGTINVTAGNSLETTSNDALADYSFQQNSGTFNLNGETITVHGNFGLFGDAIFNTGTAAGMTMDIGTNPANGPVFTMDGTSEWHIETSDPINQIDIAGTWNFTGSGTIYYDSAVGVDIALDPDIDYAHLVLDSAGTTLTANNIQDISGDLTVSAGTLVADAGAGSNITVSGSTIDFTGGGFTHNDGNFTFTIGGAPGPNLTSAGVDFYDITVANPGGFDEFGLADDLTVENDIDIQIGIFNLRGNNLTVGGDLITTGVLGDVGFTNGGGSVTFDGSLGPAETAVAPATTNLIASGGPPANPFTDLIVSNGQFLQFTQDLGGGPEGVDVDNDFTIQDGSEVYVNGRTLTVANDMNINEGSLFTDEETITFENLNLLHADSNLYIESDDTEADITINGVWTNTLGTVHYSNTTAEVDTTVLSEGTPYVNLTINPTEALAEYSLEINTVAETLSITNGILNSADFDLNISDSWLNTGGTFNAGAGTVTFDGVGQQMIIGSNTFFDFDKTAGTEIYFEEGETQTILGDFALAGTGVADLEIRSVDYTIPAAPVFDSGNIHTLDAQGTTDNVDFVDVKDSTNIVEIDPNNCVLSGNTTNWCPEPEEEPAGGGGGSRGSGSGSLSQFNFQSTNQDPNATDEDEEDQVTGDLQQANNTEDEEDTEEDEEDSETGSLQQANNTEDEEDTEEQQEDEDIEIFEVIITRQVPNGSLQQANNTNNNGSLQQANNNNNGNFFQATNGDIQIEEGNNNGSFQNKNNGGGDDDSNGGGNFAALNRLKMNQIPKQKYQNASFDTDGDGIPDSAEKKLGTDPNNPNDKPADSNNNGFADAWEQAFDINPENGKSDSDNDGCSDMIEYWLGTSPNTSDSDWDGITDCEEYLLFDTDPLFPDNFENLGLRFTSPKPNQSVSDSQLTIRGTAPDKAKVMIYLRDNQQDQEILLGTIIAVDNKFVLRSTDKIQDGKYEITGISESGLTTPPVTFTVDRSKSIDTPKVISLSEAEITEETLIKNIDIQIIDNKPTVVGKTELGTLIEATFQSIVQSSILVADSDEGNFEISAPYELEDGPHIVHVHATRFSDQVISETVSIPFTIKDGEISR